jgi:hypothetical protein
MTVGYRGEYLNRREREATGKWIKLHNESHDLYVSPNIIRAMK